MSNEYLTTLNYSFKTETAYETVVERLEASNASFEAMAFSDVVEFDGQEIPVPPTLIKEGGEEVRPSEIKTHPEFLKIVALFGGNGKAFDEQIKSDTPVVEYGKKPYYPFDFGEVEKLVNGWGIIPNAPQMTRNQLFFYIRRTLLLQEINKALEAKKDG